MKKTYNTPKTKVVFLQTQRMIAESLKLDSTNTQTFGNSLSREGGSADWDDED